MAAGAAAPTGPGFTSPNLDMGRTPSTAESKDEGTMTSSEVGARDVQAGPNYVDILPPGLLARMCFWLDNLRICNLAIASRRCLQEVMGLSGAQRALTTTGLGSLVGQELPTDMGGRGYDLRGRIEQVGAFSIGHFQDLFQKAKLTPEWNLVPEELKTRFERIFTAFKDSLVRELEKCKELQGADFSRLFNLITNGEIDASFSRPPKGLTESQTQKIEKLQRAFRQLNDLYISLVRRFVTDIAPRMQPPPPPVAEMKQFFTGIITSLKESGDLQVEESEIEKLVLENLPLLLDMMPIRPRETPENIAAVKEAFTYLVTELIRFELAKLIPEERLQLEATLKETFELVKPLFGISVKLFIEQSKTEAEADHQAQIAARPPALGPGPFFQPPRPVGWLAGLGSQLIMGINAFGITSFALNRFQISQNLQSHWTATIFVALSVLRDQIRNHPSFSVREKLFMLSAIGSFFIAALAIEGLSPVIDRYFDSPVGYMCGNLLGRDLLQP